ncbi:MAG: hypothetical protein ACNA8W_19685, partial [Bradymonadaceae bacterium]
TTTHVTNATTNYPFEPVAQAGHLQSTPQPLPGFDPSCHYRLDDEGGIADYDPVVKTIEVAVGCTEDPAAFAHLLNPSSADLACGFAPQSGDCAGDIIPDTEFFPPSSAYREIPKVLRAEDYMSDGALDADRLRADFQCMSLVGTRGYGFEKGLQAVTLAVSPDLTGGANAGFLRSQARTAVIFVTDDNDCSHDGTLDEKSACSTGVCAHANRPGLENSPLIPVEDLKTEFLGNLAASKGQPVYEDEVIVASIHGAYNRFDEEPPSTCSIEPSCDPDSSEIVAYSGDRYDRFIRQFPTYYPRPTTPDAPLAGLICHEFGPELQTIAGLYAPVSWSCLTNVYPCPATDSCPDFFGDGPSDECGLTDSGTDYCANALRVRLVVEGTTLASHDRLEATEYCLEGTFEAADERTTCVVAPERYGWTECTGNPAGVQLAWTAGQWPNALRGIDVEVEVARARD